ncbi:glycine oxidase ThiO [Arthrobacter deserti]|uniref:glycine oxidase n=1 Tax=Arthrobacter deserti TaxID=1742687 RepID=A0ABX1JRU1_9MICC|nr:glycine oxidase ThiO [Arthrobacter deserti]
MARDADVAVVGAGIVGLAIAWEAARAGRSVVVIDPEPGSGATFAAAGMLAPVSELHYQEEDLLGLTLASAALYPEFIAPLAAAGVASGFRPTGTLVVGADAADRQALADLRQLQLRHGRGVEPLGLRQVRGQEPMLGPQLSCASSIEQDHQVDPRILAAGLQAALAGSATGKGRDGWLLRDRAARLLHADPSDASSAVTGVGLAGGTAVRAGEVVLANGLGAAGIGGLPEGLRLPLRPVHGDILRLRVPAPLRPLLTATVRGLVRGLPVYLVPREDGTVVLGATQREDGSAEVSAGGVYQLLRDAQVLVPAVAELELGEATARARPGTPDNAPLLGRVAAGGTCVPGLILATGFFRHGVLLAPAAARICRLLMGGRGDPGWDRFRPDRFSPSLIEKSLM